MSINKIFYQNLFRHLFSNPCQVEYWDGDIETYGEGDPEFKLVLYEPIPKADIISDPSLAFGEAYMHNKVEIEGSVQRVIESLYNNQASFLHDKNTYTKLAKLFSNNLKRSKENVQHHYDIGNDFYRLWLDYRELKNRFFDRVVSVGMIEHVGKEHLREYFSTVNQLLPDGGVSLLHSITSYEEAATNSWIEKYIFPGGYIPSVQELIGDMAANGFIVLDVESLRLHYAKTLEHWAANFEQALPVINETKDHTFIRMWRLYLNSCAASFKCGNIDVHQFLFAKGVNNDWPWTRDYMCQPLIFTPVE
ncbi:MAG: class I SAM-dependent methyltransferase [Desulfitobacteriaceae bacterium]